jgi:hypothetical protein
MLGLNGSLNARARSVVKAFVDARRRAPAFLLACGVFPEVSEPGSDKLHHIVHELSLRHLNGRRHERALRAAFARCGTSAETRDRLEQELNALLTAETTAAYVFGLAAGLSVRKLEDTLDA